MSINESFAQNITGKTISFQFQPYGGGTGKITKATPRLIEGVKDFCSLRGNVYSTYEVFDLEIEMDSGSWTGALWGGVAVQGTTRDLAGKTETLNSVRYGELRDAVVNGKTIIKVAA